MALHILAQEKVWLDKAMYIDAERKYYEKLSKDSKVILFQISDNNK